MTPDQTVKLPKSWKRWCEKFNLVPYSSGRGKEAYNWFYLKGHGRVWRVNCFAELECGDSLKDFDRWALCRRYGCPMPKNEAEFLKMAKVILEKARYFGTLTFDEYYNELPN